MKFALASDLHLYFGSVFPDNTEKADVLILAGDIIEIEYLRGCSDESYVAKSLEHLAKQFKRVIWVPGNHESYGADVDLIIEQGRQWLDQYPQFSNVDFVNRRTFQIEDVYFHFATLWVDFDKGNDIVKLTVQGAMNDFRQMRIDGYRMTSELMYQEHKKDMEFITNALVPGAKNVVVTHHAPCKISNDGPFPYTAVSHGWFSELSEFIMDHPEIKYWCHGHVHMKKYYPIDETMVVCNPRGYIRHEPIADSFALEFYTV